MVEPRRLQAYGIGFNQLIAAIRAANRETNGVRLEMAESEYVVRIVGYTCSLDVLGAVPTGVFTNGKPVLLRDVAELRFGPAPRNGDGENAKAVIDAVKARLETVRANLPPGAEIIPVYDRSTLIERAVSSLRGKLMEELLLLSLVCALFLRHARSVLVVVVSLPLGVLIALTT